jgi:putative ABC transport system permease protein
MIRDAALLALRTLAGHPFRTALTVLSVTIGSFSIVVMMSLATAGQRTLARAIEEVGGAQLMMWIPSDDLKPADRAVYDRGFTTADLQRLRAVPHLTTAGALGVYGRSMVWAQADKAVRADVAGAQDGVLELLSWTPTSGRTLTEADGTEQRRVTVITATLAQELFGDENPIGQTASILDKPYRVVGVLEERDGMGLHFGFDWRRTAFVPLRTAEVREGRDERERYVLGRTEAASHNDLVTDVSTSILLAAHRGVEDFQVLDFSRILSQFYQFFLILDALVALIAGISLFAGGVGVMNIMLVSVTERVREIGIRKAVGASRLDILGQFVVEATVVSLLGGGVGVLAGIAVTGLAHAGIAIAYEGWVPALSLPGVALSLGVTAAIGLGFGAVPAWRAARLDIVECLRR